MKIQYLGPFDSVIVPDLAREVARGEVVELVKPEELEVGARLIEQVDSWAEAQTGKAPTPPPAETEASERGVTDGERAF